MNIANRITLWVVLASSAVLVPTSCVSYRATLGTLRKQLALIQPLFTYNIEAKIAAQSGNIETIVRMAAYEIEAKHVRSEREYFELFERCLKEEEPIYGMILAFAPDGPDPRRGAWYLHRDGDDPEAPPLAVDLAASEGSEPIVSRDWYARCAETKMPFWSKPYRGRTTGVPMITFSMPMRDDEGRFLGVVGCDISLEWLNAFIGKIKLPRSEVDQIFLFARDGTVLADKYWGLVHENIYRVAEERNDADLERIARLMFSGGSGEADYRSPDGRITGKVVYMPIDDMDGDRVPDWALGVFVPIQAIRGYAFHVGRTQALIGLLGMILLLVAFRIVARGISQPIRELHDAAMTIASGNLDAAVPSMKYRDELAALADSFERMQEELKVHIASLAEATRLREQMESELRIARRIQMSLVPTHLPDTFPIDGFDLAFFMEPAREVGGDFYDFFFLDDETLCLVVADVSGKGVPASLLMARTSTLFRNSLINRRRLGAALEQVNREMCHENEECMFITLFAMSVHIPSGACRMVNAGHNPPFLVRRDRKPEPFDFAHSLPVGVDAASRYAENEFRLDEGDLVFLYTDGVTEATDERGDLFGENRVAESLADRKEKNCGEIIETVQHEILRFAGPTPQSDDITMLVFRRTVVS